jgi:hypothetical protein
MGQDSDRNMLVLVGAALASGFFIGLIVAPRGRGSTDSKSRACGNLVFGNIIIGSNNGTDTSMSFGYDDSGDNR